MKRLTTSDPESKSADLVAENIEKLKGLFPEIMTEGPNGPAVNVDVLKALVGDRAVTDAEEKYGLTWHGKRRARQLALTPSTGTLRPCPEDSVDWDTTQNLVIEGDNLEVLKLLQKSYAGKVKLIYIDPPYNTGKDFVYPDNFQDNIRNYLELTWQVDGDGRKIISNTETSGRFHTDWLNMMYSRLRLARNLLRADGVIFITIDDHEVATLRSLSDEVFGEENCQGILVWQHSVQPKGYSGTFSVHHNFILCYQKGEDFELASLDRTEAHNKNYSNPDNDPNGPWRSGDVRNALYRPNLIYKITTPSGKTIEPPPNGWRWSKETVKAKIESGEIVFSPDETRIIRKIYLNKLEGRTPETILFGKDVGTTRDAASEIKQRFDGAVPFDTPKPTGLIRHFITLSGARGEDLVLDFFAGSGTTAEAVWQCNVSDQHQLRTIMVQLPEPLDPTNKDQKTAAEFCDKLGKPRNIAELTKERLRRAGAKIREEGTGRKGEEKNAPSSPLPLFSSSSSEPNPTGAASAATEPASERPLDLGFRVFKLATSNIRAWQPDRENLEQSLLDSVDHLDEDRTEADILYELLLKLGLDLCVPMEKREVGSQEAEGGKGWRVHTVHSVGAGTLMACLSERIERADVEPIGHAMVQWHKELAPAGETTSVFRDSAFADDVAKTNLAAILEQNGITTVRSL